MPLSDEDEEQIYAAYEQAFGHPSRWPADVKRAYRKEILEAEEQAGD